MNRPSSQLTKRVLLVGNFLSSFRGTQGVIETLTVKLRDNNWNVFTTSDKENKLLRIIDMMLTTYKTRKKIDIAIVDVYSGLSFVWAEIIAWQLTLFRKPFVITLRGGNLPSFAERWPGRVQNLLKKASAVTTPSSHIQNSFTHIRQDIVLLRNPLELGNYEFTHRATVVPKLAWLRAFHSIYNPSMIVKAIAHLQDDYPDIEVSMYGPDKKDGSLEAFNSLAKSLDVEQRLHIVGSIPKAKVPEMLGQHDIFLNTTTAESFGVSVMEAAALGMCIVTTDVGELPYIWTHEYDALLVPSGDAEAMANAIRRILTEPGLAEHLSRNARATAEKFDWRYILPQWETLLSQVIENHDNE